MKNKTKIILSLILVVSIALGAFLWNNQLQNYIETPAEFDLSPLDFLNNKNSSNINPLTGLVMDKNMVNSRPVAVMINNLHSGQPLLGVCDADIMYECPTEGGITRILAVFKDPSNVTAIGSVRSSRPYFIKIAKGLDAIYIHLGGSTHAYQILNSGFIDSIDLIKEKFMWRDANRLKNLGLEHSALTSGEKLREGIKANGFRTELKKNYKYPQVFDESSPVLSGTSANKVTAVFSGYKSTTFTYDEKNQTYLISQFNAPQMDNNVKKQNSKPNIILMDISAQNIDNTELLSLDLIGNGSGKYISRGKAINIKWHRPNDTSPFEFFSADDQKPLIMLPGQSYVCLMAQWTHVNIE